MNEFYFKILDSEIFCSEEIVPGVILDYDINDNIVGVEIIR